MTTSVIKSNLPIGKLNKPFFYPENAFDKCGWLKKQGGTFKTMKRRYFVLVNDMLYYFTNNTRSTLKGQINLRNLELSDLEEDKGSGEYSFYLLPEFGKDCVNVTHERFQLLSNDKKDAESWIQHLKQNIYLRRDGGLFGTPLTTVRKYLKSEYSYVPRIVFECCNRIREIGMDEEGIFRKNGQQSLVHQMKLNVDRAQYNWSDVDIHTICSLLKLYLRELPEPLIPYQNYDSLKAVGYRIDVGEELDLVRDKLRILPPANLQLLKYLCEFLLEVSTHPKNRMEIASLAKVFSPNILRYQDTDPYIEESSSSLISITVAAFIKSQEELFIFEYEPLEIYDGENTENTKEDDTYSLASAFSNISFAASCMKFDELNGSTILKPFQNPKHERVKSMAIPNYHSDSNLLNSSAFSQSTDSMEMFKPPNLNGQYVDLIPLPWKRHNKKNSIDEKPEHRKQSNTICDKCQSLERQLLLVTEEKDKLKELYDNKTKSCAQLEKEIKDLQLQLSENSKTKSTNSSDLSEVMAYLKMNR